MITRGAVYWVSFGGSIGAEISKTRPAVVVSNDDWNEHFRTVTVAPLSSKGRIHDYEVVVPAGVVGDGRPCRIRTHQLRAVDKSRLRKPMGSLPPEILACLDASLRTHLGL